MEIERQYKNKYLRDISTHAELLVYDWTGGGDVEVVSVVYFILLFYYILH